MKSLDELERVTIYVQALVLVVLISETVSGEFSKICMGLIGIVLLMFQFRSVLNRKYNSTLMASVVYLIGYGFLYFQYSISNCEWMFGAFAASTVFVSSVKIQSEQL